MEHTPVKIADRTLTVSCIVPAYNEAERISDVLTALAADRLLLEIIVVDDGSTDRTAARVEPFVARDARFRLIRLPENRGKAAAMVVGADQSSSDVMLFLDADLRGMTPGHVRALVDPVLAGECAMTLGRFVTSDGEPDIAHVGPSYHFSGERCLRWSLFREAPGLYWARYGAETALNLHARRNGLVVQTVPLVDVSHCSRMSKNGTVGGLRHSVRVWREIGLYQLRCALTGRFAESLGNATKRIFVPRSRRLDEPES